MQHDDALRAIESAATALEREKRKIDVALQGLKLAADALRLEEEAPSGGAWSGAVEEFIYTEEPPPEPPSAPPEPAPEPERPEAASITVDAAAEIVAVWLRNVGPKLQVEVERHFNEWPVTFVNEVLTKLKTDGTLERNVQTGFRYKHKRWSPKVTPPPPEPAKEARGSGVRQDTAGTVSTRRSGDVPVRRNQSASGYARQSFLPPNPVVDQTITRDDGTYTWNGSRWVFAAYPHLRPDYVEREKELLRVFEYLAASGEALTAQEINRDLFRGSINKAKMNRLMTMGVDRGLFAKGERRRSTTSPPGTRHSDTFKVEPGTVFTSKSPGVAPKADAAPATKEPVRQEPLPLPTLEQVRDAAVSYVGPFDTEAIIAKLRISDTKLNRAAIKEHLLTLDRRGVIASANGEERSDPMHKWEYVKPTEEGAAARIDRERRPQQSPQARSAEVPGTGRGIRVGNKEVQTIVDAALRKWPNSVEFLSKHIRVKLPDGGTVTIAHTPNQRGLLRDKAKLRKAGLALG